MDIFTINLDSRPDRWNRVMAIQRAFPWARFHRIPAVSVPIFPIAGCTVSHQSAVFMACVENMPSITVAEDDLEPTRYFSEWPKVVAQAQALGLDYVCGAVATSEDNAPTEYLGNIERANRMHAVGEVHLIEARNGRGTHLITYFESAYQKILGLQFGVPVDAAISQHPELRGGFALPFVAVQGSGHSDLCDYSYETPKLYEGSASRWIERLGFQIQEPLSSMLAPVVARSSGIESVAKLTQLDVIAGRNRRQPAGDASRLMETKANG
jgi:hypothetical protein